MATESKTYRQSSIVRRPIALFLGKFKFIAIADRTAILILIVLVAIDITSVLTESAIALYLDNNPDVSRDTFQFFRSTTEFGLWATIGYLKFLTIIIILYQIYRSVGEISYIFLMIVFTYLVCDDMFQFHERVGEAMSATAPPLAWMNQFKIDNHHFWELAYFVAVGPVIIALLALAVFFAGRAHLANVAAIALMVLAIGFFTVVIDFLDQVAGQYSRVVGKLLGMLDDGGENMMASLALGFLLMVRARLSGAPLALQGASAAAGRRRA